MFASKLAKLPRAENSVKPLYMMVTLRSVTHILNQNNRVLGHKNHSTVARTGEMSVYYAPLLKSRRNTG